MNKLSQDKRIQILHMLCEGSSMRSISRIVGVSINTVTKLLVDAGTACAVYHDEHVRGVQSKRVQCDEIWSFCYAKQKNVPEGMEGVAGDIWTWTGIDADSKLMISDMMGGRDAESAKLIMNDLCSRLANRVQLTTDGLKSYLEAIEGAFGNDIDYSMLVKIYGENTEGQKRYSPAECVGIRKEVITGNPDPKQISTSYVERQNLNMRMGMRRFTRLTNAFSKKLENHFHALALYFMYYNYVRIHMTLKVTPAMAAGIESRLWNMSDLATLVENWENEQHKIKWGR